MTSTGTVSRARKVGTSRDARRRHRKSRADQRGLAMDAAAVADGAPSPVTTPTSEVDFFPDAESPAPSRRLRTGQVMVKRRSVRRRPPAEVRTGCGGWAPRAPAGSIGFIVQLIRYLRGRWLSAVQEQTTQLRRSRCQATCGRPPGGLRAGWRRQEQMPVRPAR